jgi:sugar phosphate isomerase/epimerase
MKLGFSTIGCPEWDWEDIVSAASDLGYDGIEVRGVKNELALPSIPQFGPGQVDATCKTLRRLGLALPCLTSGCVIGRAEGMDAAMKEARQYIDTAQTLGADYVRVLCEDTAAPKHPVDPELVKTALKELGVYAAQRGVEALLETNGYYADTKRLAELMEAIDTKGIGLLWDIHHPFRFFAEAPAETVKRIGQWVKYVHVKNSVIHNGQIRYKMLGQGDLPISDFINALCDIGYDGWYTLEWVRRWDMTLEEPGIAFAHYISFMKENSYQRS